MSIAEKNTIISANNVTIAENEQKVYDKGYLEGLSKGKKTQYIEEYFTGSKQYLTYSIDFEPKLIVFHSSDGPNIYDANKPDIEIKQLNVLKMLFNSELGFAEGQNYKTRAATAYVYNHSDNTQKYATSTGIYANCAFNPTTQKWDITLGRADTSTAATRFVSGGQYANQILISGE